ncbi:endocellulase [Mycena rebaudengoi]|nr:endocellulase [Mycena rebaudengoi]
MHFLAVAVLACVSGLTSAQQLPTISGPFDCLPAGGYNLCQNLWGRAAGVGSQNSSLVSSSPQNVSWVTSYTWANGPNNVKSYANVESVAAKGVQLNKLTSAPAVWSWFYAAQSTGLRANVAYDIWLGRASSGRPATSASSFEIMIWLSGLGGIQPVGQQITTETVIGDNTWNIWKGPNANWQVISFVSARGDLNWFNEDLKVFLDYLVAEQGVPATQFVQSIQAGSEAFVGTATLVTERYIVSIAQ